MIYEIATSDFFYLSQVTSSNTDFAISRIDNKGNVRWSKLYENSKAYGSLIYSPIHELLLHDYSNDNNVYFILTLINSTDGNYLRSYISSQSNFRPYYGCTLTNDESTLFCGIRDVNTYAVLKFGINSSRFHVAYYTYGYFHIIGIVAIRSNEVMFHLEKQSPAKMHIMKATFTDDSFSETSHKSMTGWTSTGNYALCSLDEDEETVWHAVRRSNLVYFQHNLTDMSLIGSIYASSQVVNPYLLSMDVADGIVLIVARDTVLIINETTQDMIQLYRTYTTYIYKVLLIDGYINFIDHTYGTPQYTTHNQIPTSFGRDNNLPFYEKFNDYTFNQTTSFPISDESLFSTTPTEISLSNNTVSVSEYPIEVLVNESYALNLPNVFDHNLIVSPGQNSTLDLPCRLDDFNGSLTCEVDDDSPPSWATLDCANSLVQVQELNTNVNLSDSFSIKSTYFHGDLASTFNITLVPCDVPNCQSCANGVCVACSTGYELSNDTSLCEVIIRNCSIGEEWNNQTLTCELIAANCSSREEWNNQTLECESIATNCSSGYEWNNQTLTCESIATNCSLGEEWNNQTLVCESIATNCSSGYEWNNETSSCVRVEESSLCTTEPTYEQTAFTKIAQAAAGIGIIFGLLGSSFSSHSAQDAWNIIHFIQLVLILPLVAKFIKGKAEEFIVANAFSAFSMYVISIESIESIPLIRDLSFDQPDGYLKSLGLSSGSTLVNNFILLSILFIAAIVHFLFCLLYLWTKNKESKFSSMVLKVNRFFTFTFYIRIFILIYMFTLLMIVSEIKYYSKNGGDDNFGHQKCGQDIKVRGNYVSLIISCILLILPLLFLLLAFISWTKNKENKKIDEQCKTREFYSGLLILPKRYLYQVQEGDEGQDPIIESSMKKVKMARLYYILFLSRRLMLVLITILIPDSLFALRASLFLILQASYIVYMILIRSFTEKKDQIVEILNEVVILIILIILDIYNSESKWTSAVVYTIIGIVLFQILLLTLVSIIGVIVQLIRFIKECKDRGKNLDPEVAHNVNQLHEESKNCDISYSFNDLSNQNLPVIPQNIARFTIKENPYHDSDEEDVKEGCE